MKAELLNFFISVWISFPPYGEYLFQYTRKYCMQYEVFPVLHTGFWFKRTIVIIEFYMLGITKSIVSILFKNTMLRE